jgi:hypothetical protein
MVRPRDDAYPPMKVTLTGATGLIGTATCARCRCAWRRRHRVPSRDPDRARARWRRRRARPASARGAGADRGVERATRSSTVGERRPALDRRCAPGDPPRLREFGTRNRVAGLTESTRARARWSAPWAPTTLGHTATSPSLRTRPRRRLPGRRAGWEKRGPCGGASWAAGDPAQGRVVLGRDGGALEDAAAPPARRPRAGGRRASALIHGDANPSRARRRDLTARSARPSPPPTATGARWPRPRRPAFARSRLAGAVLRRHGPDRHHRPAMGWAAPRMATATPPRRVSATPPAMVRVAW